MSDVHEMRVRVGMAMKMTILFLSVKQLEQFVVVFYSSLLAMLTVELKKHFRFG